MNEHIIDTTEELDALPIGAVVVHATTWPFCTYQKGDDGDWHSTTGDVESSTILDGATLTVAFHPGRPSRTPAVEDMARAMYALDHPGEPDDESEMRPYRTYARLVCEKALLLGRTEAEIFSDAAAAAVGMVGDEVLALMPAHDAQVKAEAWDEGWAECVRWNTYNAGGEPRNPYRTKSEASA